MKNFLVFTLMVFYSAMSFAHVNCAVIELISATSNSITLYGPTTNDCEDHTYQIVQRVAGSTDPWQNSLFSHSVNDNLITIGGLEPCTAYEFRISVYCNGEIVGGCQTFPYETECVIDCEDCLNNLGIKHKYNGCEAEFVLDYNSGTCGAITPISYDWDFGFPGGQQSGGFFISTTFPHDGTFNVCVTYTFEIAETGEICVVETCTDVVITDCGTNCEECLNNMGIKHESNGCEAEFVLDYNSGTCGAITPISYDWDFGFPGGQQSGGFFISTTFPHDGTFNVCVTYTFEIVETGEICVVETCTDVVITDCGTNCEECLNNMGIKHESNGCEAEFVLDYNSGTCGAITPISYDWDFGFPGGQQSGGFFISTTFPHDGTFNVCVTYTFEIVETGEICVVETCTDVVITDCGTNCEECLNNMGIKHESNGCEAEFVLDYNSGTCGAITPISYDWDFGFPGGQQSGGFFISTTFPHDGTFNVCVTYTFEIVETGEICVVETCTDVVITDCGFNCEDCTTLIDVQVIDRDRCDYTLLANYGLQAGCGQISIDGFDWDFGFPGGQQTGGEIITTSFPNDGIYFVTVTMRFTIVETGQQCELTVTTPIEVEGCGCGGCLHVNGLELISEKDCAATILFDFNIGECPPPITINGVTWTIDGQVVQVSPFYMTTLTFPCAGTFIVSATISFTNGLGETCRYTMTEEITVTACDELCSESEDGGFTNGRSADTDLSKAISTAEFSPNPFTQSGTFTINVQESSHALIRIFDISGKLIVSMDEEMKAGINKLDINFVDNPSGIYFYTIDTSSEQLSGKIIKQ